MRSRRSAAFVPMFAVSVLVATISSAQPPARYPAHWWAPISEIGKPDWEILPQSARPGEVILSKRNELGILSNFAATPFTFRRKRYASVEGFWQMMLYPESASDPRAQSPDVTWRHTREQVAQMTSFQAKEAGTLAEANMQKLGIQWVTFEGERMPYRSMKKGEHYRLIREAMLAKLNQNAKVRQVLLSTGDLILRPDHIQEKDAPPEWAYFQIWMEIRSEIQKPEHAKSIDLVPKPAASSVEFFDEPKFAVAGVTESAYMGGHGSDTVVRSSEALTKATASLSKESSSNASSSESSENSLRAAIAREPGSFAANDQLASLLFAAGRYREALVYLEHALDLRPNDAELHRLLANSDENLGKPLDAVREYQRAAELDPSETNFFDWGTELLVHRAPEPAIDVFGQAIRMFPRSSRLRLGAAVALYIRGDYPQAARRFFEATDLKPDDAAPYLFLGKVEASEITHSDDFLARMARFSKLCPNDPWANYYYAASLWKLRKEETDKQTLGQVQSLLEKAVTLDPKMTVAYLQLGVLDASKLDLPAAIHAYRKAIELDPQMQEAHFRLAQAYRQTGDLQGAQQEMKIFQQLSTSSAEASKRERSELQRFVVTLKTPPSQ